MRILIDYIMSKMKENDCPISGISQNFNANESLTLTFKDGTMIELVVKQKTGDNK
jgi:hypothetical protein